MRQIELLRFTIDVLDRLNMSYAIVGSFASGAWGEPRMTRDIDIVVQLPSAQVDQLCDAFPEDEFYVSRTAANEAVARHGQFNVIHPASGNKIDFMIARSGWPTVQLTRRRQFIFDDNTSAYVAAPEDIILGKLIYYLDGKSEKHLRDITGIMMVSGAEVDRDYITQHAAPLGVAEIWQSVLDHLETHGARD